MTKLLSIWFKLTLTTLDVLYIHSKLAFQRFRFYIEENWIIGVQFRCAVMGSYVHLFTFPEKYLQS